MRASAGEPARVRDIRQWEQVRATLVFFQLSNIAPLAYVRTYALVHLPVMWHVVTYCKDG